MTAFLFCSNTLSSYCGGVLEDGQLTVPLLGGYPAR
jgi:hypothetical protein